MEKDIIIAQASAIGTSAVCLLRLSGMGCITLTNQIFSKDLEGVPSHTIHYGTLADLNGNNIDDCLISVFRAPTSYTLISTFIKLGARLANRGEFTLRAFLNGQLDLSQAEAVADLINADSDKSHELALKQLRGGFSTKLKEIRAKLIDLASLLELELDFGEEDVEFADRQQLLDTVNELGTEVETMVASYRIGNVMKHGIRTVIAGKPNAGKSTLMNALLEDDRAIVSAQAGTTRDTIEEALMIDGVKYILTDTAGIHSSNNEIEKLGILKTKEKISQADMVLYVKDLSSVTEAGELMEEMKELEYSGSMLLVLSKADLMEQLFQDHLVRKIKSAKPESTVICCSALNGINIKRIKELMSELMIKDEISDNSVLTNQRHYEALSNTREAITAIKAGMEKKLSADLLAIHIKDALQQIGLITGEICTDDLLENIFSKFCIGK